MKDISIYKELVRFLKGESTLTVTIGGCPGGSFQASKLEDFKDKYRWPRYIAVVKDNHGTDWCIGAIESLEEMLEVAR